VLPAPLVVTTEPETVAIPVSVIVYIKFASLVEDVVRVKDSP
jgi:hypothetical protein